MSKPTNDFTAEVLNSIIGKYAVVRTNNAGVHTGVVATVDKDLVILLNSRRLWEWHAAAGVALSGVAQHGLHKTEKSKVDTANPVIYVTGVLEIIPCTPQAAESIDKY